MARALVVAIDLGQEKLAGAVTGDGTGAQGTAGACAVHIHLKGGFGVLVTVCHELLLDDKLGAFAQLGRGLTLGGVHALNLGGVHFHVAVGFLLDVGFRVDDPLAGALTNADMFFDVQHL